MIHAEQHRRLIVKAQLGVSDAAVVPMADDLKGEVPVAFVVERKVGQSTPDELKQYFLENGAAYMHPRRITILDALPLTGAKKVDRVALREMAVKGAA